MTEGDTDIEFDFFDEPGTEEATERPRLPRRPAGSGPPPGPRMRTPQGFIPMLRLAGLIAFLILAVIVLVFVLRGCASSSKHATYSNYMAKMTTIGSDSAQLGKQLHSALAATGIKEPDLASSTAMESVWRRIHGTATTSSPAGDHGSALSSVTALPDGKQLSTSTETTVTATTDLAFRVAVQDSGSFQEFDVKVTLTIAKTGAPIVKSKTIAIINAGETKTVVFSDLGAPPFGVPTTVKVDIQPVPGEKNTTNNSAEYRVIFSLG